MRLVASALCLIGLLAAHGTADPISQLSAVARKYQEIGSYESSAVARKPLGGEVFGQIHLQFAYAAARMTPKDLPIPMLPQLIRMRFEVVDKHGQPAAAANGGATGPGPVFDFAQIAWGITSARQIGSEKVHDHLCKIIEAQYESRRRNLTFQPIKYWVDPATSTIWKMQFDEPSQPSIAHWTVVWDSWIENQAPPKWLIETDSKMLVGKELPALIGYAAPDVVGNSLTGDHFQLSKLSGDVVVLDFWATWCGPCAEEMASLERLQSSLAGQKVQVWGITESKSEDAKRWMAEHKRSLPTVVVAPETAFHAYHVDSLPQIVIVGRNGAVVNQWAGLKLETDLRQRIEELIAQ